MHAEQSLRDLGEDQQQPRGRGEIGGRTDQQMQAARPVESSRIEQPQVLEIALRPAAIANRVVDDRRGEFLIAAVDHHHMHRPATPAQQRRLDHIVALDQPTERRRTGKIGQPAAFGEGTGADDRIMPPEISLGARPPHQPGRGDRAIGTGRELHPALEQSARIDDHRHGLQQPDGRLAFHDRSHAQHRAAAHQAVGIEHDHLLIGAAEPAHPFGDVARLLADILDAPTIIDRDRRGRGEFRPGGLLQLAVQLARIAEDEEIEEGRAAGIGDRLRHRGDPAEGGLDALVMHRHQDRGAVAQRAGRPRNRREAGVVPGDQVDEPDQPADEAERDPTHQRQEQREQQHIEHADAVLAERDAHPGGGIHAKHRGRDDQQQALGEQPRRDGARLDRAGGITVEALLGHRERRLRGEGGGTHHDDKGSIRVSERAELLWRRNSRRSFGLLASVRISRVTRQRPLWRASG